MPLYQDIARRLEELVSQGTLAPGDRLPSMRGLSREWGISITTVQEAYRRLENAGVIEARPQSGHYVRARPLAVVAGGGGPERVSLEAARPTVGDLVWSIIRDGATPGLVQFGAAVPCSDLLPVEKLNRALASATRRAKARALAYQSTAGIGDLRAEIARRALEAGCRLHPDHVVVTSGCMEAVTLALRVLCRAGDTIAVESPMYFGHVQAAEALGLNLLEIPTNERDGLSVEALRFALDHHDVAAVLASPNYSNPLGTLMPDERKRELVSLLAERDVPLIEDDLYGDLPHEGARPRAAKSWDEGGGVVWCSSVSKSLAPGWRMGWVASERWHGAIERLKMTMSITSPTPQQLALLEFFQTGGYDHHLRQMRRQLGARMARLLRIVGETFPRGTRTTRPTGGMVAWVTMPDTVDAVALYRAAQQQGISVAPGIMFSTTARYRSCVRLNAAYATEENAAALATVGRLATDLARETGTEAAGTELPAG